MRDLVSEKEGMAAKRLSINIEEKAGVVTVVPGIPPVPQQRLRVRLCGCTSGAPTESMLGTRPEAREGQAHLHLDRKVAWTFLHVLLTFPDL